MYGLHICKYNLHIDIYNLLIKLNSTPGLKNTANNSDGLINCLHESGQFRNTCESLKEQF
jgi:hypothetical protein